MTRKFMTKSILLYNIAGFGIVICFLWLNEVIDIPHLFFGAEATPVNVKECIFETVIVLVLCFIVSLYYMKLIKRVKYLEGFLRVCSFCKKINVEENWIPIEDYIRDRSEAEFTHSFCPECADKHYGNY